MKVCEGLTNRILDAVWLSSNPQSLTYALADQIPGLDPLRSIQAPGQRPGWIKAGRKLNRGHIRANIQINHVREPVPSLRRG